MENIAKTMVAKPRGILAMDESSPTIKKRFDGVGISDTEENRRAYRELLVTAPDLGKYISGVILFEETLYQKTKGDVPFVDCLKKQGIIPGIKVDQGAKDMDGCPGEKLTIGLDGLKDRLLKYKEQGAEFAKWRAVITIGDGIPTDDCIEANAEGLADYAKVCQSVGIVPIVEPEVLADGEHSIETCKEVSTRTLKIVFEKLKEKNVNLKGIVLKPNMIVPGLKKEVGNAKQVAKETIDVLTECVPADVPGIAFLSGGIADDDVTNFLSHMNKLGVLPWNLTFSFGRSLQREALAKFAEDLENNVPAAQKIVVRRSKESSDATVGKY